MKIKAICLLFALLILLVLSGCSQMTATLAMESEKAAPGNTPSASSPAPSIIEPAPSIEASIIPSSTASIAPSAITGTGDEEVQSGAVCAGDGYIFFTMEDQTISYSADYDRVSYIFASRPDGSERKTIFQGCMISALAYVNGWLYFVSDERNEENQGIFRIRPDGSDKQRLLSGEQISMKIYNNKIYALSYNGELNGTYSIDLNGLEQKLLFKHQDNQYETTVDSLKGVNGGYLFYDAEKWSDEEGTDAPDYFSIKKNINTGEETPLFDNSPNAETMFANRYYYCIGYEGIERHDFVTNRSKTLVKFDWLGNLPNEPFDFVYSNNIIWYTTTMFVDKTSTLFAFDINTGKTVDYGAVPRTTFGGGDLYATEEGLYYACFFDAGDYMLHGSQSQLYRLELADGKVNLIQVY